MSNKFRFSFVGMLVRMSVQVMKEKVFKELLRGLGEKSWRQTPREGLIIGSSED
jgi:hypothetical protein